MQMEVFVLGTSGMMPLPRRHLTSVMVRRDGHLHLFDCGEGTQVAMRKSELHWKKIDSIFVSHMHSDHLTGLPGLLMLSSQVERSEPLHIYGPSLLEKFIRDTRETLDMYINYDIVFHSTDRGGLLFEDKDVKIVCFPLAHTKPCMGFSIIEKMRNGIFYPEKAEALGVPKGPLWGKLQRGETVSLPDGRTVKSSEVVGNKRKGLKFSYVTDTAYFPEIAANVMNSDLLVIEGMFEHKLVADAHEKKHMTALEAAAVAKDAMVAKAGLIHYSPRYADSELKLLLRDAKQMFEPMMLLRDGMRITLAESDETVG